MGIMDTTTSQANDGSNQPSVDLVVSLEEGKNPIQENLELNTVVAWVKERFNRAKDKRQPDERRWLEAYQNFRGLYSNDIHFTDEEQSRVFVKITKTKVLAAVAQIGDVLFAGNKFPIGIEPTPKPISNTPEVVSVDFSPSNQGNNGTSLSTVVRPEIKGALKEKLEPFKDKLSFEAGKTPTSVTWEPVKIAAQKMEKKIHDR